MKKEDRRIRRTRDLLNEALIDLMIEKGYEAVTIQDIIDRADIGRSTFYYHFSDKEQLLLYSIRGLHEFLDQQRLNRSVQDPMGNFQFGFSLALLQHVQGNKRLYKAVMGKQGGALVQNLKQSMLNDLVRKEIALLSSSPEALPIPEEVIIEFVSNTFWSLLVWWMDRNMPCSAAEVDRMFHTLTFSGIGDYLG